jgi:glucokinase-like ROK family protein
MRRDSTADARIGSFVSVLDALRTGGPAARSELVGATGLNRAAVSQRVDELLAYGLLADGDRGPSTGGRAPRRVRFRAEAGYVLAADLGATSIDAAVTDLRGTIVAHVAEPADVGAGPEVILGRLDELFERCLEAARLRRDELWAIGIGVPGPVEFETGLPVSPPIMPGWNRYAIRRRFADWNVPVWVDNDVNVMALGELRAGIAVGHENVVFVKIGTGIGAGIVLQGRLYRGAEGCAGDVGHIQVLDDATRSVICRCGNVGCLEALAGGAALARDATAAATDGRSPLLGRLLEERGALSAEDVSHAAAHGDPLSLQLITDAGRLVGWMLAGLVNAFNPSLVVIGGGVAGAGDLLLAAIRENVYGRSLPLATRNLVVQRSSLDGFGGVIGAAAMAADELFGVRHLGRWIAVGTPAGLQLLAA